MRFPETRDVQRSLDSLEEDEPDNVAVGMRSVLRALNEHRVHTLIIDGPLVATGHRCPSCGWIGIEDWTCPYDETVVERREDIVADAVELALNQAARIVTVDPEAERHPREAIAALLRF